MKINLPTKLSLSRIVLALVLFIFFSITMFFFYIPDIPYLFFSWADLVCAILFGIAATTDAFDGRIARKRNLITDFGKFIDPIADKFLINGSFILLCLKVDQNGNFYLFPLITVLFVCRDLVIDALRLMLVKKDIVLAANKFGKLKTILQSIIIPIVFLNGFPLTLFGLIDIRFLDYIFIFTNFLGTLTLIASIISCVIYFVNSRHVFIENKGGE